jgi:hypothetical protein
MSQVKMIEVSLEMFNELVARVSALEEKLNKPKADSVEMTDDHAVRILAGDLADKKHKEAAEALGLTYGQVYSARLGYTFKHIVKKLKDEGTKNQWIK